MLITKGPETQSDVLSKVTLDTRLGRSLNAQNLRTEELDNFASIMTARWKYNRPEFLETLKSIGITVRFNEEEGLSAVADTVSVGPPWHMGLFGRVIKYPQISGITTSGISFDAQHCVAIDIINPSGNRVWARAGMPENPDENRGVAVAQARQIDEEYTKINETIALWQLTDLLQGLAETIKMTGLSTLRPIKISDHRIKIVVLGTADETYKKGDLRTMEEIVSECSDPEEESEEFFYRNLPRTLQYMDNILLSELIPASDQFLEKEVHIIRRDGYSTLRLVQGVEQTRNSTTQIVAIGYDDSQSGDLAYRASYMIANGYEQLLPY